MTPFALKLLRLSALTMIALALAPVLFAQASQPSSQPASKTSVDEAALAFFNQAVAAQSDANDAVEISSFRGKFNFKYHKPGGEGKGSHNGEIVQTWAYRTKKDWKTGKPVKQLAYRREFSSDLSAGRVTMVSEFGDRDFWLHDKKGARGMREASYKEDRELLLKEKRRIDRLQKLFVLKNLKFEASSLRFGGPEITLSGYLGRRILGEFTTKVRPVILREKTASAGQAGALMTLWVRTVGEKGKGLHDLIQVEIVDKANREAKTTRFLFGGHHLFPLGKDKKHLRMPRNIAYFEGAERILDISIIKPKEDVQFNCIRSAAEVDKYFKLPE